MTSDTIWFHACDTRDAFNTPLNGSIDSIYRAISSGNEARMPQQ